MFSNSKVFKLMVLSAFLAVAAARPGLFAGSPVTYYAGAPTVAVHEPVLANVGAVVKSIPTSVSHQSHSIVHDSVHYVEPIVAPVPVVRSYAAPAVAVHSTPLHHLHAAPVVHTYAAVAPVLKSVAW